jgi:hypothetical protein
MPKISELNTVSNTSTSDLMVLVKDVNGAPSTNKINVGNFMTYASRMGAYASNTEPGVIKVGENLTINSTGYLSATQTPGELPINGQENGYVLHWSDESNSSVWKTFSAPYEYSSVNQSNTYTATADDFILFVDPNNFNGDIYIKLPTDAVIGKVYEIKNVNPGDGYNVVVALADNSSILENPLTGEFQTSFTISSKGDSQEWIFDGTYYRHIGSQSYIPFFSTEANTFTEIALQNRSSGNNASGDVVVYSDAGNPVEGTGPYIDMGINSSQYNNPVYSINGPNDSYLYCIGGDLTIGTSDASTNLVFHTGGTTVNRTRMTIADDRVNVSVNNFTFSGIAGPFADDGAANTGGVLLKGFYYDSSGNVKIRLT